MNHIQITKEAVEFCAEQYGDDEEQAEEFIANLVGMLKISGESEAKKESDAVIEAARAYLEHAFTSDRHKLIDKLREYDHKKAVTS